MFDKKDQATATALKAQWDIMASSCPAVRRTIYIKRSTTVDLVAQVSAKHLGPLGF